MENKFWKIKPLEAFTHEEWEKICDGCALCCMQKIEDADTGEIYYLNHPCSLLNTTTCRCNDYKHRHELVPECAHLTPKMIRSYTWLPETCAYRCLAEGRKLPDWHPLNQQ